MYLGSAILFLTAIGFGREWHRAEAAVLFLASVVLFSGAAIVGAINAIADDLAKRSSGTRGERM